jgi:abequosyltransferase
MTNEPFFSVCIPAYNRAEFLEELLESICAQNFSDFEVLIAEDMSPQRDDIIRICQAFQKKLPLRLIINSENLGYDRNLRTLIVNSRGKFIMFLGNDDVLASDALGIANSSLRANPNVTCAIRSYSVFSRSIEKVKYTVRYFPDTCVFSGDEKFSYGVRRFGVLSGLIFDCRIAKDTLNSKYDGALYYQTFLGIECLKRGALLYISPVLSFSRDEVAPDFGNSKNENLYTPGRYTAEARLRMISGVTEIYKLSLKSEHPNISKSVEKDYATYILPFFKDQIHLDVVSYFWLWRSVASLGYGRYLRFHLIVWLAFVLKSRGLLFVENAFRCLRGVINLTVHRRV